MIRRYYVITPSPVEYRVSFVVAVVELKDFVHSLSIYQPWNVLLSLSPVVVTEIRVLTMSEDSTTYSSPIIMKRISCCQSTSHSSLFLIVEYLHEGCLLSVIQDEAVLVEGVTVHDNGCAITSILACIPLFNSV